MRPLRSNARTRAKSSGKSGRLHEVVVGAHQSLHAILNGIASSQYQHLRLQSAFSKGGQHLQTVSPRKHKIQNDEIEFLLVDQEEPLFSGGRDNHLVLLALQPLSEGASHLRFVFHYKNAQLPPAISCIVIRSLVLHGVDPNFGTVLGTSGHCEPKTVETLFPFPKYPAVRAPKAEEILTRS